MADRSNLLYQDGNGDNINSLDTDSLKYASFKTENYELTDTLLGKLAGAAASGGSSGDFIVLDTDGKIHDSLIDDGDISHDTTDGAAASTVHTAFPLLAGGRDFTAIQAYDSHKTFTLDEQIVDKKYVDDKIAAGVTGSASWKEVVLHDSQLANGSANSDGIKPAMAVYFSAQPAAGDTVIVSFDGGTTTRTYTFVANQGAESAETDVSIESSAITAMQRLVTRMNADTSRLSDAEFEADALDSINTDGVVVIILKDGSTIPATADQSGVYGTWGTQANVQVVDFEDGDYQGSTSENLPTTFDANAGFGRQATSLPANEAHSVRDTDKLAVWNNDNNTWTKIASPGAYTAGDGIDIATGVISADLLASGGLKFVSGEISVEPNDFAGEGLVDDGSDNLAIDWSTAYDDSKAVKASDLSSNANGKGASIIGIEDVGGYTDQTEVEGAIQEIYSILPAGLLADASGVSKGDVLYVSGSNTVGTCPNTEKNGFAIAKNAAASGETVRFAAKNDVITGILTSATPNNRYWWTGSGWSTTIPSTNYVYLGGYALNTTDLVVDFIRQRKNAP